MSKAIGVKHRNKKNLQEFLKENGSYISIAEGDHEYYYLPFWFKFEGDSVISFHLEDLPSQLKEALIKKRDEL